MSQGKGTREAMGTPAPPGQESRNGRRSPFTAAGGPACTAVQRMNSFSNF